MVRRRAATVLGAAVCGALSAAVIVHSLAGGVPADVHLLASRDAKIRAGMTALDAHAPPLLGAARPDIGFPPAVASANPRLPGEFFPLAVGDEAGSALYPELLGHAAGDAAPGRVVHWAYVVLMGVLAAIFPLAVAVAFRSLLAGAAAPLVLWSVLDVLPAKDVYWLPAWAFLFAIPVLQALHVRAARRRALGPGLVLALVGLSLLGGLVSSVRGRTGAPLLAGALLVLVAHERAWGRRAALAVPLLVAYVAIGSLAIPALRSERDHAIGHPELSGLYINRHATWHSVYIGLGYRPNRYGIRYNDDVAYAEAARLRPGVRPYSAEYESVLRARVLHLARSDPSFVADAIWSKTRRAVADGVQPFRFALVALPFAFLLAPRRRTFGFQLLLVAPALVVALAAPVLAVPLDTYELAFVAACGLVWLAALGALLARAELLVRAAAAGRPELRSALAALASRRVWAAAGSAALLGLGLALTVPSRASSAADTAASLAVPLQPVDSLGGRVVESWRFGGASGWLWFTPHRTVTADGLAVRTIGRASAYQGTSPSRTLPPGSYRAVLDGTVADGQLELGVLDRTQNRWLAEALFDSREPGFGRERMTASFQLSVRTPVAILLTNASVASKPARWTLRSASIRTAAG